MPLEDADTYRFDPFDVTKVWSQKDYPLIELGRMVLNRNPENYFAEVEQATFSPGTLVPGIEAVSRQNASRTSIRIWGCTPLPCRREP